MDRFSTLCLLNSKTLTLDPLRREIKSAPSTIWQPLMYRTWKYLNTLLPPLESPVTQQLFWEARPITVLS